MSDKKLKKSNLNQETSEKCLRTTKVQQAHNTTESKKERPTPKGQVAKSDREDIRAANEDDDGYDPWSDRKEKTPFWEEDPWR